MKSILFSILFFSGLLIFNPTLAKGQVSYSIDFGVLEGNNGNMFGDTTFQIPSKTNTFRNGFVVGLKGVFGTYGFFLSPGIYYQDYTVQNDFNIVSPFEKSPE
ncbi:MAG: hypothetical protein R2771_14745 [Saprospiraceae bacterium]